MSRGLNTIPTADYQDPDESGAVKDINMAASTCTDAQMKPSRILVTLIRKS